MAPRSRTQTRGSRGGAAHVRARLPPAGEEDDEELLRREQELLQQLSRTRAAVAERRRAREAEQRDEEARDQAQVRYSTVLVLNRELAVARGRVHAAPAREGDSGTSHSGEGTSAAEETSSSSTGAFPLLTMPHLDAGAPLSAGSSLRSAKLAVRSQGRRSGPGSRSSFFTPGVQSREALSPAPNSPHARRAPRHAHVQHELSFPAVSPPSHGSVAPGSGLRPALRARTSHSRGRRQEGDAAVRTEHGRAHVAWADLPSPSGGARAEGAAGAGGTGRSMAESPSHDPGVPWPSRVGPGAYSSASPTVEAVYDCEGFPAPRASTADHGRFSPMHRLTPLRGGHGSGTPSRGSSEGSHLPRRRRRRPKRSQRSSRASGRDTPGEDAASLRDALSSALQAMSSAATAGRHCVASLDTSGLRLEGKHRALLAKRAGPRVLITVLRRLHRRHLELAWAQWGSAAAAAARRADFEAASKRRGAALLLSVFECHGHELQAAAWSVWRHKSRRADQFQRLQRQRAAATLIQRRVRGLAARRRFESVLRQRWHARRKAAAGTVQRVWRGSQARKEAGRRRQAAREESAACVLQRSWHRHRATKDSRASRKELAAAARLWAEAEAAAQQQRRAAIVIQARWRGVLGRRAAAEYAWLSEREAAALTLQTAWRGTAARLCARRQRQLRRENEMALRVQCKWRGIQGRRNAGRVSEAARASRARRHAAATDVQRRWRGVLGRRAYAVRVREHAAEVAEKNAAAVAVQRVWRGQEARVRVRKELRRARVWLLGEARMVRTAV